MPRGIAKELRGRYGKKKVKGQAIKDFINDWLVPEHGLVHRKVVEKAYEKQHGVKKLMDRVSRAVVSKGHDFSLVYLSGTYVPKTGGFLWVTKTKSPGKIHGEVEEYLKKHKIKLKNPGELWVFYDRLNFKSHHFSIP